MRDDRYLGAMTLQFKKNDGGRKAAGLRGEGDDCVTRSIAIATRLPYKQVAEIVDLFGQLERRTKARRKGPSSAQTGVYKPTTRKLMAELGWTWVPTMGIGTGCTVHLRPGELPAGRLVVSVSKHLTAVIDHVIHDTYDPSREGTRCVYGYWHRPK